MDTLDIYVIGKQWMWKVQQPTGLREINELHVPVGRNVKLILASEDVIHDFSVPPFASRWMLSPATTTHVVPPHQARPLSLLLPAVLRHKSCAHGRMGNRHGAYGLCRLAFWLVRRHRNPAVAGEKLFADKACTTCHLPDGSGPRAISERVYGAQVLLADGSTVTADDAYIRESILNPQAKSWPATSP